MGTIPLNPPYQRGTLRIESISFDVVLYYNLLKELFTMFSRDIRIRLNPSTILNGPLEDMNIVLNPALEQQLKEVARLTQKTEQELVTEALERHLPELRLPKNCYDLALELGVMVVGEDLPPDLSTNPDYLEGLGT